MRTKKKKKKLWEINVSLFVCFLIVYGLIRILNSRLSSEYQSCTTYCIYYEHFLIYNFTIYFKTLEL